jgi:hypothetical protein
MTLQPLIITFNSREIVMRALYKTQDGPGPNTKARHQDGQRH